MILRVIYNQTTPSLWEIKGNNMGFGNISIWQLLIILLIVVMLFGTKRLSSLGADLGTAIKGFKKALNSDDSVQKKEATQQADQGVNKTTKERH